MNKISLKPQEALALQPIDELLKNRLRDQVYECATAAAAVRVICVWNAILEFAEQIGATCSENACDLFLSRDFEKSIRVENVGQRGLVFTLLSGGEEEFRIGPIGSNFQRDIPELISSENAFTAHVTPAGEG